MIRYCDFPRGALHTIVVITEIWMYIIFPCEIWFCFLFPRFTLQQYASSIFWCLLFWHLVNNVNWYQLNKQTSTVRVSESECESYVWMFGIILYFINHITNSRVRLKLLIDYQLHLCNSRLCGFVFPANKVHGSMISLNINYILMCAFNILNKYLIVVIIN